MEGWIKLHRKLVENPLWTCESFTRGQAWVDLVLISNHTYNYYYKRGVKIEVNRGQCGYSAVALSERWKWSRSKVNKFLNDLEKEQQIVQQKSNVTQLITIVNYDNYQQKEQQTEQQKDTKKAAEEQQKDTNKNDKKEKNDYKYKDLIEFSIEKFPKATVNKKEWDKCFRLLIESDGYTEERIKEVIKSFKENGFWSGNFMSPLKLRSKNKEKVMYIHVFDEILKHSTNTKKSLSYDASIE